MSDLDDLVALVVGGGRASAARDRGALDAAFDAIAVRSARVGRPLVGAAVARVSTTVLGAMWEGGWQPAEAVRAVRRSLGSRHAAVAATAVLAETAASRSDAPAAWTAQVAALGPRWWGDGDDWLSATAESAGGDWLESLAVAVEVLGVLLGLPRIEQLGPPPSAWGSPTWLPPDTVDDPVLQKVRALLAKAESTGFEAEADALMAKAQELMRRHAIDEAVAGAAPGGPVGRPVARRIPVDDPYASTKSSLLAVVAGANDVRCVWDGRLAAMTVVGFPTDLEAVEALFTSLLVQATTRMVAGDPTATTRPARQPGRGRAEARAYRQSFLLAFADRVGERLREASATSERVAEEELTVSLLPVLAGRRAAVDDAVGELFPKLGRRRSARITSYEGWVAGRAAGDDATLAPQRQRLAQP